MSPFGAPFSVSANSNAQPEGCALAKSRAGLAAKVCGVFLRIAGPLLRQVIACEDGRNRAYRDARAAVDAFHRIDKQLLRSGVVTLILLRMNAVDGAGIDAS